jgi:Na+-driven multidrug efflux pump
MLRCAGNMKVPSLLNIMMCALDVIFNFLLIFPTRAVSLFGVEVTIPGAGLGIFGAAIGTVAAECLTAGLMMWFLCFKQEGMKLRHAERGSYMPTRKVLGKAFKIATPMTAEHALLTGAQIMVTVIVAPLGVVAIAANAFAVTAESLCYMPGYGIGDAATTLTGQSFGAGRMDLVKRFCHLTVALGMIIMTVMGAVMYVCAPWMMELMTPVDAINQLGAEILRIQAWAERCLRHR